ncbi:hypothetical protein ElyMa_000259600 [Elysia marginata]|uniref:Uncharacterized protein n=1 Tax=Elysia marginata TaxID=1093978 RepID=A0AAV4F491_9GAST|nr:hypothetical protein ElyMa_000259600 [Elysia marginata]
MCYLLPVISGPFPAALLPESDASAPGNDRYYAAVQPLSGGAPNTAIMTGISQVEPYSPSSAHLFASPISPRIGVIPKRAHQ